MEAQLDVRTSLAISKGAVTATELINLTDDSGVPLPIDKGEHQVVVAASAPCCSHNSTRAAHPHSRTLFETSEHILIPYGLNLQFEGGPQQAHSSMLTIQQNFRLTYGQIIALGGDFYADPDHPICMESGPAAQKRKFTQNFESLRGSSDEVFKLLAVTKKYEFDPIASAVTRHQIPSGVYVRNGGDGWGFMSDADRAYDDITGGVDGLWFGRYVHIANTNFDHFGIDAVTAYLAGHAVAQEVAVAARSVQDQRERSLTLQRAYAINAFADHFLTDLFSAGHIRTPRHALYDLAWTVVTQGEASLLAQRMHDEDNKFGIWVENALGDRWVAFGDKRYRDPSNAANRRMVKRAVQKSMDEVWDAFKTGHVRVDDSAVPNFLPRLIWEMTREPTATVHREDRRNWAPLFWRRPEDGNVMRRNDLFNPADRTYCEYSSNPIDFTRWGITSTLSRIKLSGVPPYMPDAEYTRVGLPIHPDEAGPSGEFGWPAGPTAVNGAARVRYGATGPNLRDLTVKDWVIDGAPAPPDGTGLPDPDIITAV